MLSKLKGGVKNLIVVNLAFLLVSCSPKIPKPKIVPAVGKVILPEIKVKPVGGIIEGDEMCDEGSSGYILFFEVSSTKRIYTDEELERIATEKALEKAAIKYGGAIKLYTIFDVERKIYPFIIVNLYSERVCVKPFLKGANIEYK